jgi:hypothetical protein
MRTATVFAAPSAAIVLLTGFALVLLTACANQKDPAEKAVARVEASLAEFRADAEKYAADELKDVNASLTNLKNNLARQDYRAVVQGAPSVTSAVNQLKQTVDQRKADAAQLLEAAQGEWNELSASVGPAVETLQKRVDQLAKTRKYPKGLDKAGFETAKADFENAKTEWTQAAADFAEGKAAEALRRARAVKAQVTDLTQRLTAS